MYGKKEYFAGLDTHTEDAVGTLMNKEGDILNDGRIVNRPEAVDRFFMGIPPNLVKVSIESSGIWRPYYRMLKKLGYNVCLANPVKVHDIAKDKKTDQGDSRILADLLRTGYLPEIYIPTEEVMELRNLTRHRIKLVRIRTKIKNMIKGYLRRDGVEFPDRLWTRKGMLYLKRLDYDLVEHLVAVLETLNGQIELVEKKINRTSKNKIDTRIVDSISGIAEVSALTVMAEIGDIDRFDNPKSLVKYGGLCRGIYKSGKTERDVKNISYNRYLKWTMEMCAVSAIKTDDKFMKHYLRVKKRHGGGTALRAVARKMLTIIWHMLKNQEMYHK